MRYEEPSDFEITLVDTRHEIHEVAQLRYAVFTRELGTTLVGQCDDSGVISDSMDLSPSTNIVVARVREKVCAGTMRGTTLAFSAYPSYLLGQSEINDLRELGLRGEECVYCSRFALLPTFRKSSLSLQIMFKMFEVYFSKATYFLLYVSPQFFPMYSGLGGVQLGDTYTNSAGAPRILMVIPIEDLGHHRKHTTPFCDLIAGLSGKEPYLVRPGTTIS